MRQPAALLPALLAAFLVTTTLHAQAPRPSGASSDTPVTTQAPSGAPAPGGAQSGDAPGTATSSTPAPAGTQRGDTPGPSTAPAPGAGGTDPWAALGLPPAGASGTSTIPAAGSDDPWGFENTVQQDTWKDMARQQALGLGLMGGFFAFALVSFFLNNKPLKYAALVMSVAYLGITKSTLISVTDIFRLVQLDFPEFRYTLEWYLIAGFTVVTTLLFGRLYCGRICAFGALTQLLDAVVPKKFRWEPSPKVERYAGYVKYVLLVAVVGYYMATKHLTVYRYVEPFWLYTREGTPVLWAMLGTLMLATLVVRNLYCRFLCPVGAFLGIISQATTLFRIKRWSECKTCRICERTCEWGAIRGPHIVRSECVRCDDCERLYDDQKKCVHWVVVHRKSRNLPVGVKVGS